MNEASKNGAPRLLRQLDAQLEQIVREAQRSLVKVHNGRRGAGAGVILHEEGLVVTNAHVVRRQSPRVTLANGHTVQGTLLAYDEKHDLAAVSVAGTDLPVTDLRPLTLGDGNTVRAGSWVVALGHPWGVSGAATAGMVIAVGRPLERVPYEGELIQVGLHLRPGHSGGPMLDSQGHVVGINTMISGPYVGLAIPVRTVKKFLKRKLGRTGRRRAPSVA